MKTPHERSSAEGATARVCVMNWEDYTRFEVSIREVKALHHCMVCALDNGDALNGELVAGLQSLGWRTQKELDSIFDGVISKKGTP